jgi:hypothetical protein
MILIIQSKRLAFFDSLLSHVRLPPPAFPDGVPRRKRVLEQLPIAPPPPPKPPSEAALAAQRAKDLTLREILTYRLGPILADLKKRHRKSMISAEVGGNLGLISGTVTDCVRDPSGCVQGIR